MGKISNSGFSLIEVLIVIAILAVLASIVVLIINPAEYLTRTRDAKRLTQLREINQALQLIDTRNPALFGGSNSVIYTSLPDTSATCASHSLPPPPSGWQYNCVSQENLRKVTGAGWLPVNFAGLDIGSPLSALPIDPVNTAQNGLYYTYTTGSSWELNSVLESKKYRLGGEQDVVSKDGGDSWGLYEVGSKLTLSPINDKELIAYWRFDDGTGLLASDSSGSGNAGTLVAGGGSGPNWVAGQVGSGLDFEGDGDRVTVGNQNAFMQLPLTLVGWAKLDVLPSVIGSVEPIMIKADGTNNSWSFSVGSSPTAPNRPFFTIFETNITKKAVTADNSISTGAWWHQAGTVDSLGNMKLYINGVAQCPAGGWPCNTGPTLAINNTNLAIGIGAIASGGEPTDGTLDDLRIYNRALSQAEIAAIYNATK